VRGLVTDRCEIAIVGSGFTGSLLARVLAVMGRDVVLLERGAHPRFAIGESTTPLANLSLERIARRYGLADCWHLATHGRWMAHLPEVRRGLKRGFTFYRHHPGAELEDRGLESERLLVAASPDARLADTHWLRADVDHHFVRMAQAAGVDYRDGAELSSAAFDPDGATLSGRRGGAPFALRADFVVDATGPAGFLARQLGVPSALDSTETESALVFGHFDGMRLVRDVVPGLPEGPYPDDWAAVHHLLDEGWMYALRFDHGTTSAGFCLSRRGMEALARAGARGPEGIWRALLERYPTVAATFEGATPVMPLGFSPRMQHRLARAAGERWAVLPHAYAFVDPLFSTGIAWGLRAVERLALLFEPEEVERRLPGAEGLARYERLLAAEAAQIDRVVAGAYEAMRHFDLFAAQAMLYFATVSFAELRQRVREDDGAPWQGFLGVGDPVLEPLPRESLARLRALRDSNGDAAARRRFVAWIHAAIAPRNVAGLADPARHNLYPVDLDVLLDRHALLGMTREELVEALPTLRGNGPEPVFERTPQGHEIDRMSHTRCE
jgi:tetracycline 7-halogenase / FADH2 O2-dependent halogenase